MSAFARALDYNELANFKTCLQERGWTINHLKITLSQADLTRWPGQQLASRDRFDPSEPVSEHAQLPGIVRIGREPEEDFQGPSRHDARHTFSAPIDHEAEGLFVGSDLGFGHEDFHEQSYG